MPADRPTHLAPKRHILIAGGGIGGLTAALALTAAGHRVTLAEAAAEIKPLGVGINLLPHAVEILDHLELLEALRETGVETGALIFANRFGQTIHRDPRGIAAGAGHPQISIHRGELHLLLWRTAQARIGADNLHCGHRLLRFEQDETGVVAHFATSQGERTLRADLLVAADGIHSAARAQLVPGEGPPLWNGVMMWRGITRARPFLDGRTMVQAGIGDAKFVVYPVTRPAPDQPEVLINWVADMRVAPRLDAPRPAPAREDWSRPGRAEQLMPVFGAWQFDWLDVPGVINGASAIYEWPMVDRDPLPHWNFGRVALLGDAAHPMYPIGSNGATQAILDADALVRALEAAGDVQEALRAYDAERRPMATEIVRMNRLQGMDAVLDYVDARAPNGFARIEDVVDPAEIAAMIGGYKRAAGHRA